MSLVSYSGTGLTDDYQYSQYGYGGCYGGYYGYGQPVTYSPYTATCVPRQQQYGISEIGKEKLSVFGQVKSIFRKKPVAETTNVPQAEYTSPVQTYNYSTSYNPLYASYPNYPSSYTSPSYPNYTPPYTSPYTSPNSLASWLTPASFSSSYSSSYVPYSSPSYYSDYRSFPAPAYSTYAGVAPMSYSGSSWGNYCQTPQ